MTIRPLHKPPLQSMTALVQDLVRAPSQGGIDSYVEAFEVVEAWLGAADMASERIHTDAGRPVGLVSEIVMAAPGPTYVLNATIDTAPVGDEETWDEGGPFSGRIEDGWLFGRGSSDSKAGVSIFSHVGASLLPLADKLTGRVVLFFDGDEHSGTFEGAKTFFEGLMSNREVDGMMIGYPGLDRIVVGGRGFARYGIVVHGKAGHTGSSRPAESNAIDKASALVSHLVEENEKLKSQTNSSFDLPPKVTVTSIEGGTSFSVIPDRCVVNVDTRLTPSFDAAAADAIVAEAVARLDAQDPERPCDVNRLGGWPPFHTPDDTAFVVALKKAAEAVLATEVPCEVVGPSNIGNYVSQLAIPATAGFGVSYRNFHGANEAIDLATLGPVYETYLDALIELLTPDQAFA